MKPESAQEMSDSRQQILDSNVGAAVRSARVRVGMTQIQLARVIARSGKFLSEVETGKAKINRHDLEKLAQAMGVSCDALLEGATNNDPDLSVTRRIRDVQPTGLTVMNFAQLVTHLDRTGWLRGAAVWLISAEPFPEERDVALIEQLAAVIQTKKARLRYVFPAERLAASLRDQLDEIMGTAQALPPSLATALRWSPTMGDILRQDDQAVVGHPIAQPLPPLCEAHTLLWLETADVSWSEVMPLLYCRCVTRTFEKPNESSAFWYHLPREDGSRLLLEWAQLLRGKWYRGGGNGPPAGGTS